MEIDKIRDLHKKGIVTESGLIRAKIISRFEKLKGTAPKSDIYFILSQEFCLSEGRIKNIVTSYYRG